MGLLNCKYIVWEPRSTHEIGNDNFFCLLPYWPRGSVGRASEDLIQRSWVQTPPRSNFLWLVGTPKFPLKG